MSHSSKALREKRAPLAEQIKRITAEDKAVDASGKFTEEWLAVNAEFDKLSNQIEAIEKADQVTRLESEAADIRQTVGREDYRAGEGRHGSQLAKRRNDKKQRAVLVEEAGFESEDEARAYAIAAWVRLKMDHEVDDDHVNACKLLGFNPNARKLAMPLYSTESMREIQEQYRTLSKPLARKSAREYRAALSIGSGPKGGYIIPPESLTNELEINMLYYGGMRQVSETRRTATGERMSWPTADDTTNTGVQLGENTSIGSSVDPTFAKVYWDAYKFSSKPVLVPYELLQDSAFNLVVQLGGMLGVRLGRVTNTKYTLGNGAATPMGLVTKLVAIGQDTLSYPAGGGSSGGYAKGYIKSISAGTLTYDDIQNLEHSVDPAYRKDPSFMCHDQFKLQVRKLKDGIGRPLWVSNIREGMPDTLDGYRLTTNQDMDSAISTGKNVLTWGDHDYYKIRTVGEVRLYHLEERYRDLDQDAFLAFIREDGNLLYAGNLPVKLLQIT